MVTAREHAEQLARTIAPELVNHDVYVVLLEPALQRRSLPFGAVAPRERGGPLTDLDASRAASAPIVLVPLVFDPSEEGISPTQIMLQVKSSCCFVLAMLCLMPGECCSRELNDLISQRHHQLLEEGFDEVLLDPDTGPEVLQCTLEASFATWKVQSLRLQAHLDMQHDCTPGQLEEARRHHHYLLWTEMPRALMPKFPVVDPKIVETENSVGEYTMVSGLPSLDHSLMLVRDGQGAFGMCKVIEKRNVIEFSSMEGIYREFRFLASIFDHPNILKCRSVIHTESKVYAMCSYVGDKNLSDVVMEQPNQRLNDRDTFGYFSQIAGAVAYCHAHAAAIRRICPEAIFMNRTDAGKRYTCTIVEFSCATVAQTETYSHNMYGDLPCVAPEVACGDLHVPPFADRWSTGVVLLEMHGGPGTLMRIVNHDLDDDPTAAALGIFQYFMSPYSHYDAATRASITNTSIVRLLAMLLQPVPENRAPLQEVIEYMASIGMGC